MREKESVPNAARFASRIIDGMKTFAFAILFALVTFGAASTAAQTAPAEPKNYSIDPWHINVPKPVANPVTSKGNAARTTSAANLRIKSLHSNSS